MKIDRLIGILSILLQKDKVKADELAEQFEVSRRTIDRDIDDLNRAGIPVMTYRGRDGGIFIMEGFRIDRALLTQDDMRDILSGLQSLDSVCCTGRYRRLMSKLSADGSGENIIIDLSSWDKSMISEKIDMINGAVENGEKISFAYYSPTGDSRRVIEPYHLIFQWSGWYVWGFCCERQEYRLFKLSRMAELCRTGEKCEKRDVPPYVCDKLMHTKGGAEAVVRFDASVKWRVIDEFGTELPEFAPDGSITLRFTWADVPSFYRYILSFGDAAEIISPEEYREGFSELLKNISAKYKS